MLEGPGRLSATGAVVVEGTEKLLTTAAALLDGPGRQQEKHYCRVNGHGLKIICKRQRLLLLQSIRTPL